MDYKKEIGARIQNAREARNWSQAQLARETGDVLSSTRIGNYETGFRMPGPSEVVTLGRALAVKASYLMALDNFPLILTHEEEQLIQNWRTFTEKRRQEIADSIAIEALQTRAPVRDPKGDPPPIKPARARAK